MRYKELQSNAGKMQKAMSTMASQLKEAKGRFWGGTASSFFFSRDPPLRQARDTAAMFGVELPSSPGDTSNRRPSVSLPRRSRASAGSSWFAWSLAGGRR